MCRPRAARVPSSPVSGTVRVGVLGCGNVGAALVQLVAQRRKAIAARTGIDLHVTRVAVRNLSRARDVELPEGVLTRDTAERPARAKTGANGDLANSFPPEKFSGGDR